MKKPKFSTKDGYCTSYAHRCGYLDTATLNKDNRAVIMGAEGAVYFVQCFCVSPRIWETFDATSDGRKQARKRFAELVRIHRAKRNKVQA